jgi:predicted RNA-binding Zn-ribbon protein involved in translation (DUF1610 family)
MQGVRLKCKSNALRLTDDEFEANLSGMEPYEREFAIRYRKRQQAKVSEQWAAAYTTFLTGTERQVSSVVCPNCGGTLSCDYSQRSGSVGLNCSRCGAVAPCDKIATVPTYTQYAVV